MGLVDLDRLRADWPMERVLSLYHLDLGKSRVAKCPFCYEQQTTPKPTLGYRDHLWCCHRCGKGGNSFTFVQTMENLTFREAVLKLAGDPAYDKSRRKKGEPAPPTWLPPEPIFSVRDYERERQDFIRLERMMQDERLSERSQLDYRLRMGLLTDEDYHWERVALENDFDIAFSELDRVRCEVLFYLRRVTELPYSKHGYERRLATPIGKDASA